MPWVDGPGGRMHINVVPIHEVRRLPELVRWCYGCKKRLLHEDVCMKPNDPMSYYGPHWELQCTGCGKDRTVFPGRARTSRAC